MEPTDVPSTGRTPDEIFDQVRAVFTRHHPDDDGALLSRAYELATEAHAGQMRRSGDEYITHPLTVAEILANFEQDLPTIVAAILHDVIEDTEITLESVRRDFGDEVAALIDGVTKLDRVKFSTKKAQQAATIRKMAIAIARDERVLLIKLVDRLHNIRTLDNLSEEKQQRVARETLDVYAPLAHRFGVQEIKHEMEDRCFAVLYPKRDAELRGLLKKRAPERDTVLEKVQMEITSALNDAGIDAAVVGRPKHVYSIYRKMVNSGLAFEEIHDLIGIRILVPEIRDCYGALGLIHMAWPPIQGRFKDYIATPKLNGYQSLHTTVVGPDGKPLEVQIRTREMHKFAERGIAAHWAYKEGEVTGDRRGLIDELLPDQEADDPELFVEDLKSALEELQDEVYVLSPQGEVIMLPAGATPVDFAYRIHTDVGHRCVGAKVDGRLVPLSTVLHSGDVIEIITSKAQDAKPSRDWLNFVQSGRAAAKIRQYFSRERREVALQDGKDRMAKALRRDGLGSISGRDKLLRSIAEDLGFADLEALFIAVGDGRVGPNSIVGRLERILVPEPEPPEDVLLPIVDKEPRRPGRGVIVEGMDDLLSRIARCCNPVPGDDIVGFVTVGRGVSVHRSDCTNIGSLGQRHERLIDVSWAPEQEGTFFVWLQVEALDRPRLLRDVTSALSDLGANIHASSSATGRDRVAKLRYEVELPDPKLLDRALADLREVGGVFDAYRLLPNAPDR